MIYLNQAGTSWPKPDSVHEAAADALSASPDTWERRFSAQHRNVARAFGIEDASRLLLTPGATSALAVAIADHAWRAGDRVVISGFEHHALQRPAQALAQRGVEVIVAPASKGATVCLESLETTLRRGDVRVIAMTAASNVTGDLLPIEGVIALAHRYGALALVDAAQTAGWLPVDVAALGVDLLTFAGHKGPHAPWGIGGLYISPDVAMASPAASCEAPTDGDDGDCAGVPGYCDVGSVDRAALAGLSAGLAWMAVQCSRGALDRARRQVERLRDALHELPGVAVFGSASASKRMPILAFTVANRAPDEVAMALSRRGVVASGGLQCAPLAHQTLGTHPRGVTRLSVGPTLSDDDANEAAGILTDVLST